jgi:hypothetical protein
MSVRRDVGVAALVGVLHPVLVVATVVGLARAITGASVHHDADGSELMRCGRCVIGMTGG